MMQVNFILHPEILGYVQIVFSKISMPFEIERNKSKRFKYKIDLKFLKILFKNKKKIIKFKLIKLFINFKSRFTTFFWMKLHTKNIFFAYNIWKKIIFKFSERKNF